MKTAKARHKLKPACKQRASDRSTFNGVDIDQTRAVATTLGLARCIGKSRSFSTRMSEAKSWKPVNAYGGDVGSNCGGTNTAGKTTKGSGTNVNGSSRPKDNGTGPGAVRAAVELWDDGIALVAEVGENGPLHDDLGDRASEGHSTGSEDSEDGRETHDEKA